jgi:NAD(P)-dependent dehydrogenase (short-subunit alcohol dehydrogenase family)
VDVLINNAGLGGQKRVVDMSDEEWSRVLDITLTGTFRMTRAMLPPCSPRPRRHRQQRLRAGLARPKGAGPLRRRQGRA